jgi:hypothetical protein
MIFISPNLPLNEQNQVINPNDLSVQVIQNLEQHAPPMYGEHQFDQLYSNVDPSGFVTPAGGASGSTPFNLHSRNASMEDISSMGTAAEAELSANVLQNRLYNIQDHGSSRHARDRSTTVVPGTLLAEATDEQSSARNNSVPRRVLSSSVGSINRHSPSDPLSQRTSDDDATPLGPRTLRPEAQHIGINDMNDIFRLPSYGRAVRTRSERPPTKDLQRIKQPSAAHPRHRPTTLSSGAGSYCRTVVLFPGCEPRPGRGHPTSSR